MSIPAITSIALFAPIATSNVIFSSRRASKGVDSLEENPLYAAANINIAAAQILKGGRAVKSMAIATDPSLKLYNEGAKNFIQQAVTPTAKTITSNPVFKTASNVLNYTADHINPVIVGTSALKVATSDDKVDTWARESTSLLTMFAAEEGTKKLIGMPISTKINGKRGLNFRQATGAKFVKKVLSEKQVESVKKCLEKNKGARFALSVGQGLLFAGGSVTGYKAGNNLADAVLGKKNVA